MAKRIIILVYVSLMSCFHLYAQELTVKSFKENTKDLAARTNQRVDNNGTPCALVKVQLATSGAQFEGSVMGNVAYKTSEYWVYMPQGSKRLTVKMEGALPANVEFADYGVNSLTSNVTYVMAMQIKGGVASSGFSTTPKVFNINGVEFTMIPVEGGSFRMGATPEMGSNVEENEKPVHKVTLSNYYIGETEVTQELWEAVMGYNPSYYVGRKKPVTRVDIPQCEEFIRRINIITGQSFSLPTGAQWEYAARGGKQSKGYKFSGSNNLDEVGWFRYNTYEQQEVKQKRPNELGIYDMSGNVWEWIGDDNEPYTSESKIDPIGFIDGHSHYLRGGAQDNVPDSHRISARNPIADDNFIGPNVGFRIALQSLNIKGNSELSYTADYKSLQKSNVATYVYAGPAAWHKGISTPPNWDGYGISIVPNRAYRLFVETLLWQEWHIWNGEQTVAEGTGSNVVQFTPYNSTSIFPYVSGYNETVFPQYIRLTLQLLK